MEEIYRPKKVEQINDYLFQVKKIQMGMNAIINIMRTFIMCKLIQNRKCTRQQLKAEQIRLQFTVKVVKVLINRSSAGRLFHELGPWTAKYHDP